MTIKLTPNEDIAATLGKAKKQGQMIVAFALETNDEETNARLKLKKKNADFIVLNSLKNKGTCFGTDENQIEIISNGGTKSYPKKSKTEIARYIVDEIVGIANADSQGQGK